MGTDGTNRNADCLLKNASTKHTKYVVNETLEHFDHVSFVRIRVVLAMTP
jgi:hypothetical protein